MTVCACCRSRPAPLDRRKSSVASTEPFDWRIDPDSIKICTREDGSLWKLGSGAAGTVYKALLNDVDEVAVKQLSSSILSNVEQQMAKFREEINLMAACRQVTYTFIQRKC